MPEPDADLTASIAEAVAQKGGFLTGESTAEGEGEGTGKPETPPEGTPPAPPVAQGESQPGKVDSEELDAKLEPYRQADGSVVYWGTDLTGLPAEKAVELIDHFEQQDSTIQKLQTQLAKPQPEPPKPREEETEPTDEDLLRAIDLDPEDFATEGMKPVVLPLLRTMLAMEDRLDALDSSFQVNETKTAWNGALDELEGQYGKLPGDRLGVLKYAAENGIASPFEAYFKLAGPVKREVEDFVAQARKAEAQRVAGGSVRPRSGDVQTPVVTKDMSLRDAVKAAALAAEKETRFSWADAARARLIQGLGPAAE
jgi:hypothetical protein